MIALLLILIPFIGSLITFLFKGEQSAKAVALLASFGVLVTALCGVYSADINQLHFDTYWLPDLNSRFSLSMDGMSKMLCLLTAIALPVIIIASWKNSYDKPNGFFGLLLLMQAGLMGVFLASDALLFYFAWEIALIPAYFLCSIWGGNKRIQVTFKFFVYTFVGSLLMLLGILYVYFHMPQHSFSIQAFYNAGLSATDQKWVFWLFFIAFAIKMPLFPLHTWQPDTYEQSPTPVTAMLSAVMAKMGLYAVLRWLLPVFPQAVAQYSHIIIIFCVIGILYASLIAIKQDDVKRLIAYSSIAHIGLMAAAIFAYKESGLQGVMMQMFNHGINVVGLWLVADAVEKQAGTRKLSELGGLAQKLPSLAILLVVMAFANIALPLTNAFVGEFLMFNGLFSYNGWMAAIAGISIILAAVYTLNMIQKIFYGNVSVATENVQAGNFNIYAALTVLVIVVVVFGVYPQPMLDLTKDSVNQLLTYLR